MSDPDHSQTLERRVLWIGAKDTEHCGPMGLRFRVAAEAPELAADLPLQVFVVEQPFALHVYDLHILTAPPLDTPRKPGLHSARRPATGIRRPQVYLARIPRRRRISWIRTDMDAAA